MERTHDVIIIGAGPTGISCALETRRRGIDHLVIDKGTIVNTIVGYPTYMTFFSTTDKLELGGIPFTSTSPRPTRAEALEYYRGVARAERLNLWLHNRVLDIEHTAEGFRVVSEHGVARSRFLVLATGYFDQTNRLDAPGEELPKVRYYYKEPFEHVDQRVLVVGGRNSAVETALDLYRHGARVTMIHRGERFADGVKYWLRPDIENRIKEGAIEMIWRSRIVSVAEHELEIESLADGTRRTLANDIVYAHIGYRPDVRLLEAAGVLYDPETLVPVYDATTFETNVSDLFLAGSVACGCRTWEIFIENGRAHATHVAEQIASRMSRSL